MTLPIIFRGEAEREFDLARRWYDSQQRGVGLAFSRAVNACLVRVASNPQLHAEVAPGIRGCLVRRFPFAIFYRLRQDRIEVLAIFHGSRDPAELTRRF